MTASSGSSPLTVGALAQRFGAEVVGDAATVVAGLAPLDKAGSQQLAFLSNPLYLEQAAQSNAAAVIVSPADLKKLDGGAGRTWVVAPNPYALFARIAQLFAAAAAPKPAPGIAATAQIAADAVVPASCTIGPGVIIEAGAVLGERVVIQGNATIGRGASIGDDTMIYAQVSVYHGCKIGARGILHSGAVIGADGFGFAPDFSAAGGEWVKIPQTGAVVIGDDVEIGANTTIDRGAMANTEIGNGCKLDNQVQIAHNVIVGAYTVIAGCAAIAGSTKIGRYCIIGGSANCAGHLTIADRVTVSGGTSITRSIKEPGGHFTSVFPFMPHGDWEKNAALVRGLAKLRERIRKLEHK